MFVIISCDIFLDEYNPIVSPLFCGLKGSTEFGVTAMTEAASRPIGIFDSGVGGLTVMSAIIDRLPGEELIYLGDTARVPYGNRGAETVRRYALNAASLLLSHRIKALVVACNTASAFALEALRDQLPIPVFGVIRPVATRAAHLSTTGEIAVLGTRGTIRSQAYQQVLMNLRPDLNVHSIACPLLVPLAEEGWLRGSVTDQVLARYLEPLASTGIDTMILGCTHYPILRHAIAGVAGSLPLPKTTLLDSAKATSDAVADALDDAGLLRHNDAPCGTHRFLLTDLPEGFVNTAELFFGRSLDGQCEHVDIADTTSPSTTG